MVYVNDVPEADAGDNIEICAGSSGQLDGTNSSGFGTLSYSWSGTGIVSGGNTATPTISTNVNRSYTLTVTDGNGCTDTDVVNVSVTSASANAGTNQTICLGESITLAASGGVSYVWSPAASLSDPNSSSPVATPTSTTTYTVTVTDQDGCTDTDDVVVTVQTNPTLTVSSDQTICRGESVQLSASGSATAYSWSPSTGLNNINLANPTASPSVTTIYTVTATLGTGCTTTDQVIVNVNDLPDADAGRRRRNLSGNRGSASGHRGYILFLESKYGDLALVIYQTL